LNPVSFLEQFHRFKAAVAAHAESSGPFVSFGTGLPRKWERYKDVVYDEGRNLLGFEHWNQDEAGSGEILRRVIKAIEIDVPDENSRKRVPNNLVDWDSRYGPERRSHRSLYEALEGTTDRFAYESLLYDFYRDELPPEDAFAGLVEQAGRRYDFIAYLFFLKDWTCYLPISPANFDRAFAMLGVGLKTSQQCSWENYRVYIGVLRQVRDALREEGLDDVRLIEAHSFCYMLAKMELAEAPPVATPVPEPLELLPATLTGTAPVAVPTTAGGGHVTDWDRQRDERAAVGKLAEYIALDAEKGRLVRAGRGDLADRIERVADDHTKGYDIKSFNENGTDRFIEVKAVRQEDGAVSFFLTENERQQSRVLPDYFLYLVFGVRTEQPSVKYLKAADCRPDFLRPVVHLTTVPVVV
jgi:hypothetical protein